MRLSLRSVVIIGCIVLNLNACTGTHDWTPVVDRANDPKVASLGADLTQCRQLAVQAGRSGVTSRSRSNSLDSDGVMINDSIFRRSYANCLKERGHPVIN